MLDLDLDQLAGRHAADAESASLREEPAVLVVEVGVALVDGRQLDELDAELARAGRESRQGRHLGRAALCELVFEFDVRLHGDSWPFADGSAPGYGEAGSFMVA